MTTTLPPVLAISGSDSSGGAGMQADLKTMLANGVFGMSAITALTAQNTMGVTAVQNADPGMVAGQIDAVFADIPPLAVKIGMVSSAALIEAIADRLIAHHARNIVLDPVMVATSGSRLIDDDAVEALTTRLFPLATVITPNIPETEVLAGLNVDPSRWAEDAGNSDSRSVEDSSGFGHTSMDAATATDMYGESDDDGESPLSPTSIGSIDSPATMEFAGRLLTRKYGCAVLVKGGHGVDDANDVLVEPDGTATWFNGIRVDNPNTHGTGCTLSSAIASNLAKDETLPDAIRHAKDYLTGALKAQLNLGHGSGPMDHAWAWR